MSRSFDCVLPESDGHAVGQVAPATQSSDSGKPRQRQLNPFLHPSALLRGAKSVPDDRTIGEPCWWLLHTKPRQEKKLAEELFALDIPHYLPVTRHKAITRGKARYSWAPLFPSYFFLWATQEDRLVALRTNRLVRDYPISDQEGLSEQLMQLAELIEKEVPLTIEDRLVAGQPVRVKSGLLKDQRGVVLRRGGRTRLYIYVTDMLGGVSIEIEQHRLEPY